MTYDGKEGAANCQKDLAIRIFGMQHDMGWGKHGNIWACRVEGD